MLKELKYLTPIIKFRKLSSGIDILDIWTFSDAFFNIASGGDYGQTGIVSGINVRDENGEQAFHLIYWERTKKRWINHSSHDAETLAC